MSISIEYAVIPIHCSGAHGDAAGKVGAKPLIPSCRV